MQGKYNLDLSLPYPVNEAKGSAKFDKVTCKIDAMGSIARDEEEAQ